ncbi:formylglycine-generating enzyme family protein [Fluviicola sp.]|uniref:formylglycine-generating enzyme family protein n=1 Tax=Fluviicola sp. TaxID=1917219 RepID=UPI003D27EE60
MDKQQHLEQLFLLAKQDQVVQSFEQTKERFIASASAPSVNKTKTKQVFTKKWMIMLATVSTISLSLFLLLNKGETSQLDLKSTETNTKQAISEHKNTQPKKIKSETTKQGSIPSAKIGAPFLESIQELVTELPFISESKVIEDRLGTQANWNPKPPKGLDDLPYQFPKLTEEEINITNKKKKSMLKALVKHDKNAYVFIPSGTFDYNGTQTSVQAFYIGIGEVTNFEYRTFLFDLLIQGRNDEFLKAKPDQSAWSKELNGGGNAYTEHYFSHKAYNEYPVVNVSREGAELYCLWLSQEVRKYVGDEKEAQYNDVRLPLRVEWVKAASNEGKQLPYPWNGQYRRNSAGMYQANFTHDIIKDQVDTTGFSKIKYDNSDITAPSKSFWANALGLYNMSGNVAEMVYEGMNKSEPGTAGGSWRSSGDDIKIYAPDPNKGVIDAKPTIGFRVVSTYLIVYKK